MEALAARRAGFYLTLAFVIMSSVACHHRGVDQSDFSIVRRNPRGTDGAVAATLGIVADAMMENTKSTLPVCVGFRRLHRGFDYLYNPQQGVLDLINKSARVVPIKDCPNVSSRIFHRIDPYLSEPVKVLITGEKYQGDEYADFLILGKQSNIEWRFRCWAYRTGRRWTPRCSPNVNVVILS